ncbi:hypothetical protein KQX63_23765 [Rhodopseudomonas palustris]|uniref:hypothetical protein n=1 Tax=Rhodopseudomonas palustris TaxID=1076 RepID=UPI0021F360BD|nr:hypothetical protein [Rhodopseudomonas palustris]UYO44334.1 hypothetical protein KQX63_23765 [Rhodopseudomonas palustris]
MKTFAVKHVNFEEYADALAGPVAKAYGACGKKPRLFIEPGTAIVADTLHFFARVVDVKQVAGTRFATVNGSIFNISASARKTNLPVEVVSASVASRHSSSGPCTIVGYTCIEGDCLTVQFDGAADVGDFVHYSNVGSYSVVMKPPFILPNVAMVRFDRDSWEPKLVKAPESFEDVFSTFVF